MYDTGDGSLCHCVHVPINHLYFTIFPPSCQQATKKGGSPKPPRGAIVISWIMPQRTVLCGNSVLLSFLPKGSLKLFQCPLFDAAHVRARDLQKLGNLPLSPWLAATKTVAHGDDLSLPWCQTGLHVTQDTV